MRLRDVPDYLTLRRVASNAWRTLQYCKRSPSRVSHRVQLRSAAELELRADRPDARVLYRIFARDEYRLTTLDLDHPRSAQPETLQRIRHIHGEYHDRERDNPRSRIERFTGFLEAAGFAVSLEAHRRKPDHGMFFARAT